jgi:hypothetical protein
MQPNMTHPCVHKTVAHIQTFSHTNLVTQSNNTKHHNTNTIIVTQLNICVNISSAHTILLFSGPHTIVYCGQRHRICNKATHALCTPQSPNYTGEYMQIHNSVLPVVANCPLTNLKQGKHGPKNPTRNVTHIYAQKNPYVAPTVSAHSKYTRLHEDVAPALAKQHNYINTWPICYQK